MLNLGSEIVIATRNAGKVKEFEPMFRQQGIAVKSLLDYDGIPDVVEDGETFAANALIKARTIALKLGVAVVADDSGLCVDRLNGEPGVYSARYAGDHGDDEANNRKLLQELGKLPAPEEGTAEHKYQSLSTARFVSALCLVDPNGRIVSEVEGTCEGHILPEARGDNGFGYDPLFYIPSLGRTLAELTVEEKNEISHRGKAIRALWKELAQK